jgi:hypothetical protein
MSEADLRQQIKDIQAGGPYERVALHADSELAPKWRPIKTAPTDSTNLLVFDPEWVGDGCNGELIAYGWPYRGVVEWRTVPEDVAVEPTHWMPLPAPPET